MTNSKKEIALVLSFIAALSLSLAAGNVSASALTTTLDSPTGVTFSACTNASSLTKYTEKNIGITRKTGPGTVTATQGNTFLQMNGSGSKSKGTRSARVKSTFSFSVAGSGTLTFDHRVSTWGSLNDDFLVFYEGSIDDDDDLIWEIGGNYWGKYSKEGLLPGYRVTVETFWDSSTIYLDTDSYYHTVGVALLAPLNSEDYVDPTDEEEGGDEDAVMLYKAWLDNFVWDSDEKAVCDFSPASGTMFGAKGLTVYLSSDYSTVSFYYTTDGSKPSSSSTRYNAETGIAINQDTVLTVAAYEGSRLIGNTYSAEYTRRPAPEAPVCTVAAQAPTGNAVVSFSVPESTLELDFYYTTDGSEPTLSSASGKSCELSKACTLKVCAADTDILGKVSTYTVKNASVPELQFSSKNYIFDEVGEITFQMQKGSAYYTLNGGNVQKYSDSVTITETTTLAYWTCVDYGQEQLTGGSEILLNSTKATQTLTQAELGTSSWITEQITSEGWNLVGMTRQFSSETGDKLAEYLDAYDYDIAKKSFVSTTNMEPGRAYWVYGNEHEIPKQIYYVDKVAVPVSATGKWEMSSGDADYIYEGGVFRAVEDGEDAPGWKKGE